MSSRRPRTPAPVPCAVVGAAASGDTINFDPSLKGQTITVTAGEIALKQSLTIDGQALAINITSGLASRVFFSDDITLKETISNRTFRGNTAKAALAGGNGGAIYNSGALTLNNDVFTENTATGDGGAVYSHCGVQVAVNNCTFQSNSCGADANGGAMSVLNNLTVAGGTFHGNSAGDSGARSITKSWSLLLVAGA